MLFKNERLCFGNYSQILSRYEDTVKRCFFARLPVHSSTLPRCAAFWGVMQIGHAAFRHALARFHRTRGMTVHLDASICVLRFDLTAMFAISLKMGGYVEGSPQLAWHEQAAEE
jgi:hypothetical protein